jgi:tRNA G18 (ribose-2'-O)-methylase SpoU
MISARKISVQLSSWHRRLLIIVIGYSCHGISSNTLSGAKKVASIDIPREFASRCCNLSFAFAIPTLSARLESAV